MNYTLTRVTAPTDDVITLAEARMQLRVDTIGSPPTSHEDDLIQELVDGAVQQLDAQPDGSGWLGRAIAPQTWRLGLPCFPGGPGGTGRIYLPFPPLIAVTGFTYVDDDGNTQSLVAGTDYRVLEDNRMHGFVAPIFEGEWPDDPRTDHDAVQITFVCGYGSGSPVVAEIPVVLKNAVRAQITEWYDTRGVTEERNLSRSITNTIENLRVRDYSPW